jgi:hypothetical protein
LGASYKEAGCKGYRDTCKINTTKSICKMKTFQQFNEDLEARRQQLAKKQKEHLATFKKRSAASVNAQKERISANQEREQLKKEIKQELQTEQHPTMEPNEFNKQIAKRQAGWKGLQRQQAHDEMKDEARSQVSAKRIRMKAIMSR